MCLADCFEGGVMSEYNLEVVKLRARLLIYSK